ncbi:hypothetical protein DFAR_3060003 [Desulfarculales bacterium]
MPEDSLNDILQRHGVGASEPTTQVAETPAPASVQPPQETGALDEILKRHGVGAPAAPAVAAPPPQADFTKVLQDNQHLDFVDRIMKPEQYPVIENPDGTVSTHKMASGEVNGKNIVYPTIVRDKVSGELRELPPQEAMKYAADTGEHISFPTREEAERFGSGGYKEAAQKLVSKPLGTVAPNATPPQDEIVPGGFGGQVKEESVGAPRALPEAFAPAAALAASGKPLYEQVWDTANSLAANIDKPVIDVFHGLAKGLDDLIARGGLLAQGEWKAALMGDGKPVPAYLSQVTGAIPGAFGVDEAIKASDPVTKFIGSLAGGLWAYMIPGGAATKFAKATEMAPLAQKFLTNLLTFSTTDVLTAAGNNGTPEEVRAAFIKSIPTAALFTVAQVLPYDKVTKSPWMKKALESTGTGTAFAGSHALGGTTDPAELATSFLTGFFLHGIQSTLMEGLPRRGMKIDWAGTEADNLAKAAQQDYLNFRAEWMRRNQITEEMWAQMKPILDDIAKGAPPLYRTPEVASPYTPEQKLEMMFGSRAETLRLPEAEAVRQLTAEIGGHEKAQRFYDLFKAWDADTAMSEFPELSTQATQQQRAAEVTPQTPSRAAGPMIPGAYSAAERRVAPEAKPESVFKPQEELPGALGKPSMVEEVPRDYRSLVNKVNEAGDPATASQLNDIMGKNQETLNQLLGTPREARGGMLNLVDRVEILWDRINETGDPAAAKELTELLKTNEERMRALPRLAPPTSVTNVARPDGPAIPGAAVAESLGITPKEAAPVEKPVMPEAIVPTKEGTGEQAPLFPKEAEATPTEPGPGPRVTPEGELEGYSVEQAAPIFYSQMAKSLDQVLPGKGDGPELAKTIRRWTAQGGVKVKDKHFPMKAEELKWSGLEDWLVEQKGKVTKQEILDYLDKNQVEIEEVHKGSPEPNNEAQQRLEELAQRADELQDSMEADRIEAYRSEYAQAQKGGFVKRSSLKKEGGPRDRVDPGRDYPRQSPGRGQSSCSRFREWFPAASGMGIGKRYI